MICRGEALLRSYEFLLKGLLYEKYRGCMFS